MLCRALVCFGFAARSEVFAWNMEATSPVWIVATLAIWTAKLIREGQLVIGETSSKLILVPHSEYTLFIICIAGRLLYLTKFPKYFQWTLVQ